MAVMHAPPAPPSRDDPAPEHGRAWTATVATGLALLFLLAVHIVANHFVVHEVGGLRTYHQVLEYLSHPVILVTETLLLVVVTIHAMLGLRSVLLDVDMGARARRRVHACLWALGCLTVAYGVGLLLTLASRA